MESVGQGMGAAGETVDSASKTVGADKAAEAAGDAVTSTGDAVGRVSGAAGVKAENIEQVPVVGSQFRVNAMSTALSCVINLTLQYMIVYTALALVRCWADYFKYSNSSLLETLDQARLTVNYAPMLACLFLACRMRVNWLTQGKGNPPTYIQVCMLCCTYSVLCMTLVAVVIPIFTGEKIEHDDQGHMKEDPKFQNWCVAISFTVLKYLIMIGLYVGVVSIIYGIIGYEPPAGSWPGDVIPPPSPAVACTMILTTVYFLVYALIQAGKTFTSFFPSWTYIEKITGAVQGAICTMAFAPMLSILFIAARMRALQMDPIDGHPQRWAQACFYAATYALLLQCVLAICIPLLLGGEVKKGNRGEGDVEYTVVNNKLCGTFLEVIRWIVMISIYLGFMCVIWSIFTIQHPKGPEYTPPISVTMQCVINLTVQYFTVYFFIWVCLTINELFGIKMKLLQNTMENAIGTIAFCPMLAILFVGTRMRALRLTNNRGAPQGWVQDGMYCATWAILIQFFMVLLIPVATYLMEGTAQQGEVDKDGNTRFKPRMEGITGKILFFVIQAIRWLGFLLLYGGVIAVIVGAIMMTPETANGRGSLPLVRETPFGQEPVGPNDMPGMPKQGSAPPQDSNAAE